jgi:response regulator of citrate/malate metabolism
MKLIKENELVMLQNTLALYLQKRTETCSDSLEKEYIDLYFKITNKILEKEQLALLLWDKTLWKVKAKNEHGSYIIESEAGEIMKVKADEIILVN